MQVRVREAVVRGVQRGAGESLLTNDRGPAGIGDRRINTDADGVARNDGNPSDHISGTGFGEQLLRAIARFERFAFERPTHGLLPLRGGAGEYGDARGRLLAAAEEQARRCGDDDGADYPGAPRGERGCGACHAHDITGPPEDLPWRRVVHNRHVPTTDPVTSSVASKDAPKVDAVLRDARDLAHDAVTDDVGPAIVGEHVGFVMDAERVGTHSFACIDPAYVGWRWAVTVARAPRAKVATICEIVLLPGPESLLAPEWIPWSDRILPGDLGVGDVLPTAANDDRLAAGLTGAEEIDAIVDRDEPRGWSGWEVGLGRTRVMSIDGRDAAAERWDGGEFGPNAAMAEAAPKPCATCGFLVHVAGPLSRAFGVCANEFAPADGRLVSLAYGCGAHSEVVEPDATGDL